MNSITRLSGLSTAFLGTALLTTVGSGCQKLDSISKGEVKDIPHTSKPLEFLIPIGAPKKVARPEIVDEAKLQKDLRLKDYECGILFFLQGQSNKLSYKLSSQPFGLSGLFETKAEKEQAVKLSSLIKEKLD